MVLAEAISLIIRQDRLLDAWHNDWDAFVRLVPNETLCWDTEIVRVGFMTPRGVEEYVHELEAYGLIYRDELGTARDMVVVDQQRGLCMRCEWIECGHFYLRDDKTERVTACALKGSAVSELFTPKSWTFENSLSHSFGWVPTGKKDRSLTFLRRKEGMNVYRNALTGREVFIAEPEGAEKDC
jgi:hypothetical protein